MTPITAKDRQAWLARPDTEIFTFCGIFEWRAIAHAETAKERIENPVKYMYCRRTKIAAINAAIRAERKAK